MVSWLSLFIRWCLSSMIVWVRTTLPSRVKVANSRLVPLPEATLPHRSQLSCAKQKDPKSLVELGNPLVRPCCSRYSGAHPALRLLSSLYQRKNFWVKLPTTLSGRAMSWICEAILKPSWRSVVLLFPREGHCGTQQCCFPHRQSDSSQNPKLSQEEREYRRQKMHKAACKLVMLLTLC